MATQYIKYPSAGGVPTYANVGAFPTTAADGSLAVALDTESLYIFDFNLMQWLLLASGTTASLSIGPFGNTPNANGGSVSGSVLTLQPADSTHPGGILAGAQTIGGHKTIQGVDNNIELAIKATAGQSVSTFNIKDSSNATIADIDINGLLTLTNGISSPGQNIDIAGGTIAVRRLRTAIATVANGIDLVLGTLFSTSGSFAIDYSGTDPAGLRLAMGNDTAGVGGTTAAFKATANGDGTKAVVRFQMAAGQTGAALIIQDNATVPIFTVSPSGGVLATGTIEGAQFIDDGLTVSRAVVSDGSKQLTSSATTATEIGFVSGVTSSIQTQINAIVSGSATARKETFVLSGTDITNQFIDLTHVAKTNSVQVLVKGGLPGLEGASYDFSVSYTGGSGGNTRITFLNTWATGGVSAFVAADVLQVVYLS